MTHFDIVVGNNKNIEKLNEETTMNENDYEMVKFYETLSKILYNGRKLGLLLNDIENVFDKIFTQEQYDNYYKELRGKEKFQFLNNIISKKLKKITCKKSVLQKKIENFSKILGLEETEIRVLQCFIYQNVFPLYKCLLEQLDKTYTGRCIPNNVLSFILDENEIVISSVLTNLGQKGILDTDDYYLNKDIKNLFLQSDVFKKNDIIKFLLGEKEKTDLKISDYKHLKNEVDTVACIIKNALLKRETGINILFWGSVGTGKTELTKVLAKNLRLNLYSVTTEDCCNRVADLQERLSDYKRKQLILANTNNSFLLFDEAEDVMNDSYQFSHYCSKSYMNRLLERNTVPVIWITNNISTVDKAFLRRMTYAVRFDELTNDVRLELWKKEILKNKFKVDTAKLVELNNSYRIPPSLITNAIKTTKLTNGTFEDFEKYVKNVSTLINCEQNKCPKCSENIVYNSSLINADIDIENLTKKIVSVGKLNFSLCLYGQSGTGKSAYAKYLAKELGSNVLLKQASDLISPYVGETEIKISKAFEEAKNKKAMLIIDEADSFLQSRQNAVRNWEVSQVNQMLTSMENHPYPFVCTTNLIDILDEASLRRFTFKIKFNFLNKEQVKKAFKHYFKIEAPDEITNLYGLTLGDFSTVYKKSDYLDCRDNNTELAKLLQDEVNMKSKDIIGSRIGF